MANLKWSLIDLFLIFLSSFVVVSHGVVDVHCSNEERDALLRLKAAITEDSPGILKSWNASSDCCIWAGITCDPATGTVIGLRLRGHPGGTGSLKGTLPTSLGRLKYLRDLTIVGMAQLGGQIPKTLSLLTNLTRLILDENRLEGPVPQTLSRLRSLQVLSLQVNRLSGDLPRSLGALTSLRALKLGFNNLTGRVPRSLGQLVHLHTLDLSHNSLSGDIPSNIGTFRRLSALDLSFDQFTGSIPPSLCSLTRALEIDLSGNHLTGEIPSGIGELRSLKSLHLESNFLSGSIPESVRKLDALEELNLARNKLVSPLPKSLADGFGMSSLQSIDLSHNELNLGTIPSWMLTRRNLFSLALAGCELAGALPEPENPRLRDVDLSRNDFTGGLAEFVRGLSGLQTIRLSLNKLEGNISGIQWPEGLINIDLSRNKLQGSTSGLLDKANATLSSVNLSNNEITGALPEFMAGSNLRYLNLSMNLLTGQIPESIGNLHRLRKLDLSNNHIGGPIPPGAGDMVSLEVLDVSGNALTSAIPENLNKLVVIKRANFARNQLCGDLPKGVFFDKLGPDAYDHKKCVCGPSIKEC